jgi:uncharacterized membrane protein YqaE (UPF0057 family)
MRLPRGFPSFLLHWRFDSLHLLAVVLPPLAVRKAGHAELVPLSILLTLFMWVPGVAHAWHVVGRSRWEREQQFVAAFQHHLRH